jgi:hypothetical protein
MNGMTCVLSRMIIQTVWIGSDSERRATGILNLHFSLATGQA